MARIKHYNPNTQEWEYSDVSSTIKGDKGDPFTFEDFTPEQLASLKGEKGETGTVDYSRIDEHNSSSSAHSSLFNAKEDKPNQITGTGAINVTITNNTEYTYTSVTSLTMTGNASEAHGFITFGSSTPTISVSGFTGSTGDDIISAAVSQTWEFSSYKGYIVWKNWSA